MRSGLLSILLLASCSKPGPEIRIAFRDVAPETGLHFRHDNAAKGQFHMPEIMGSGAALLDFDSDGDLDVFLVQSGPGGHKLFRNELSPEGKLRFQEVPAPPGASGYGMGAATGDFDRDGKPDLLVTQFGGNLLFRNRGDGTFEDVTPQSPAVRKTGIWSSSASFFDYDRDGWQDLVILSYVDFSPQTAKRCASTTGEPDYCTPVAFRSVPARLFHNESGRFVDVTQASGIDRATGPGLGVQAIDANNDGWLDLFVANDTAANHLWINQRNGTFAEKALEFGTAYSESGLAKAGMGVAAGDFNSDGRDDLLVLNLMREGATLFQADANGYRDVSMPTKIHSLTFLFTGFGTGWFDADNDGALDLFLANGAVTLRPEKSYAEKNLLLRNRNGVFEDATAGEALQHLEVTRGAAFGDIDNDGRVDILITNNNGPARLLRNESAPAPWLQVQLHGPGLGLGTRVGLEFEDGSSTWRRVHTDGSYASASSPIVHFGLGARKPRRLLAGDQQRDLTDPSVTGSKIVIQLR